MLRKVLRPRRVLILHNVSWLFSNVQWVARRVLWRQHSELGNMRGCQRSILRLLKSELLMRRNISWLLRRILMLLVIKLLIWRKRWELLLVRG
jgi:hypothetical protein